MKRSAFATKLQAAEDACADKEAQIQRLENDNRSLKLMNLRYERELRTYELWHGAAPPLTLRLTPGPAQTHAWPHGPMHGTHGCR